MKQKSSELDMDDIGKHLMMLVEGGYDMYQELKGKMTDMTAMWLIQLEGVGVEMS